MEKLSNQEVEWLLRMRQLRGRIFIGIDHHAGQLTVAMAKGGDILDAHANERGWSCIGSHVYEQDSRGYTALLEDIAKQFPDQSKEDYLFLSEPSYAKPCSSFLLQSGIAASQVLWVDTRKASQYRKTYHLGTAGKNDADDARALVAMLYRATTDPAAPFRLFKMPNRDQTAEALGNLAQEHRRLTKQSVQLQNKIFQRVLELFPEASQVWHRSEQLKKPDGSTFKRDVLDLFGGVTAMRVLAHFPGARHVRQAGFEAIWAKVGRTGIAKAPLRKLVQLAETSAGLDDELRARQLKLWINEYHEVQQRLAAYESEMTAICAQDRVFASFMRIKFLSIQGLATILGAIGQVDRNESIDQVKRHLNIAPQPLPHTGVIDEQGKPVQIWRFPANTYQRVNGQKRIRYESPGRKDVREVGYLWFKSLYQGYRKTEDPFARHYAVLKQTHQGKSRWLGRVRWKVVAKLIETIYYCWKYQRPYDPALVTVKTTAMSVAG